MSSGISRDCAPEEAIATFASATAESFTGGHTLVSASIDSVATNPDPPSGVLAVITNSDPTASNTQQWTLPAHGTDLQTFTLNVGGEGYSDMLAAVIGSADTNDIMEKVKVIMTVDSQKDDAYTTAAAADTIVEDGDEKGTCLQTSSGCDLTASHQGMQDEIPAITNAITCNLPSLDSVNTGDTLAASANLAGTGFSATEISFAIKEETVCGWDVTYTTKYRVSLQFEDTDTAQDIGTPLSVVVTNTHTTSFAGFSRSVDISGAVTYVTGDLTQAVASVIGDTDSTTSSSSAISSGITFARTNTVTCTGALVELGDCAPMAVCAFKYTATCLPDSTHTWASGETVTLTYSNLDRDSSGGAFFTSNEAIALSPADSKGATGDNALNTWVTAAKCSTTDDTATPLNCLYLNGASSAVDLADADSLSVSAAKFTEFTSGVWDEDDAAISQFTELMFYVHYPTTPENGASQVIEMRMTFSVAVTGAVVNDD